MSEFKTINGYAVKDETARNAAAAAVELASRSGIQVRNTRRNFRLIRKNASAISGADSGYIAQGYCNDKNYYHFFALIDENENATLIKTTNDGYISASREIGKSHANDLTYRNGFVYMINCLTNEANQTFTISKIDAETLNVVHTKSIIGKAVCGISFDDETGELYAADSTNVYRLEETEDNYVFAETIPVNTISGFTPQSIVVRNRILYYLSVLPDTITCIDLNKNEVVEYYTPPKFFEDVWEYGELEGIDFNKDGNIVVSSWIRCGSCVEYNMIQLFEIQWKKRFPQNTPKVNHGGEYFEITVDSGSDSPNPNGITNPFKYACEAAMYLHAPHLTQYSHKKMNFVTGGQYGSMDLSNINGLAIYANYSRIGSITCLNAANIELNGVVIVRTCTEANYNLRAFLTSNLVLTNTAFERAENTRICVFERSIVNFRAMKTSLDGVTPYNPATDKDAIFIDANSSTLMLNFTNVFARIKTNGTKMLVNVPLPVVSTAFEIGTGNLPTVETDGWFGVSGCDTIDTLLAAGGRLEAVAIINGNKYKLHAYKRSKILNGFFFNLADSTPFDPYFYELQLQVSDQSVTATKCNSYSVSKQGAIADASATIENIYIVFDE